MQVGEICVEDGGFPKSSVLDAAGWTMLSKYQIKQSKNTVNTNSTTVFFLGMRKKKEKKDVSKWKPTLNPGCVSTLNFCLLTLYHFEDLIPVHGNSPVGELNKTNTLPFEMNQLYTNTVYTVNIDTLE